MVSDRKTKPGAESARGRADPAHARSDAAQPHAGLRGAGLRLISALVLLLAIGLFLALPFVLSIGSVVFLPLVSAIILTIVLSPLADRLAARSAFRTSSPRSLRWCCSLPGCCWRW